jgi:1,4-dihydroxy-2-naphthoate octaprenyltransferase
LHPVVVANPSGLNSIGRLRGWCAHPAGAKCDNTWMGRLWAFVRLSRPHFLLGGALLFALGSAGAGDIAWLQYALGQAMVTSMQITAHFVNEYADREVDRAIDRRTMFSGGSGVLVSGDLKPEVALRAAWASTTIGVILAAVVAVGSPLAAGIGLIALAVSWGYSMPPIRLLGTGWGELATSLVVVVAVPVIGWAVQQAPASVALWWAVGILLPVHMAMMLAFELPDIESDAVAGKRVLGVRLGEARSGRLIAIMLVLAGAIAMMGVAVGGIAGGAAWAVAAGLIPALILLGAARNRSYAVATLAAVSTLVVTAGALVVVVAG